ncbi:hypothetical protein AXW83_13465 [Bosea sp. PAMC 26642]|nr:type I secretion system permease/ATPase [Bosea sp. PAMC 26642]AMJ61169.1 hypothetical protein AXW83_13465 [Bosea sp. PAMC 26642]
MPALGSLVFFSFIITLLCLIPSLYMIQIFDRVLQSRSISTLLALASIVIVLTIIWTALEIIRQRTLQRIAVALDEKISARVFDALNRQSDLLPAAQRNIVVQDLNVLRDFVGGNLVIQLLDFIWVPIILLAAFLYHPMLGLTVLVLTVIVVILALLSQSLARDDSRRAASSGVNAAEFGRSVMQSAEATRVMGMLPRLVGRWRDQQRDSLGWQAAAVQRTKVVTGIMKWFRHIYMPVLLTVGAILYLNEEIGAGVTIASTLLAGRAVQPVDSIASSWRVFWNVKISADRVDAILDVAARMSDKIVLPDPAGPLVLSRVMATPHNRDVVVLSDVSFAVDPGRVVGVVGASGAGKSSLARVLTGGWGIKKGSISLDGHQLSHWDQDRLGRFVGYVPQDVEMLPGTVAENIARFEALGGDNDAKVIEAAQVANIQDIIGRLPNGFNTKLGPDGHVLSGGQRQRVALARAVFGNPRLLVLDEPNSNLDSIGEKSLGETIITMRDRGAIVILITHRMNMLTYCDDILVLNAGTVHTFGPKEHVLDRLSGYRPGKDAINAITSPPMMQAS